MGEKEKEHIISDGDDKEGDAKVSHSISLGTKLGIIAAEDVIMETANDKNTDQGTQRYSGRIVSKNRDDVPMLDRAMSLARAKNLALFEGMSSDLVNVHTENVELIDVANLLGIDLGVSLGMVEHNLHLAYLHENARKELFLASAREETNTQETEKDLQPEDVNSILQDLLTLSMEGDDDQIDEQMERMFCGVGGSHTKNSAHFEAVAVKTPVKTVLRRKKKKE